MAEQILDFDNPPADPVPLARSWFDHAQRESGQTNPNAMTLATVDADGHPWARVVLMKNFDDRGVVFFTNKESAKGQQLAAHPHVALAFHWDRLERQVLISGRVDALTPEEDDAYFASRERDSRIGAWASRQSAPLDSREELEARVRELENTYRDADVPRPPHWGGYRVSLDRIEFWQGRPSRLHDRLVYTASAGGWSTRRIQP
ncbi:MAG: pyridoxamine 5'-phosphate oxidase [Phycisphaerales bacterium]|nr:pyridoxamine 5'-phosphate oxidase [Phycisphaerales bacterium]